MVALDEYDVHQGSRFSHRVGELNIPVLPRVMLKSRE